jgi:hypothetical protein
MARRQKREFYIVCKYADPVDGGEHISCTDVTVYGKLDAAKVVEIMDVCAEKFGVDRANLVITFFAELES